MNASATVAVIVALTAAAPAQAGVVAEMKVGNSLGQLVVGTDGGAWVAIERDGLDESIGRARPDGSFRTAATDQSTLDGVLGPDGAAWYQTIDAGFLRADAAGALTELGDATVRGQLEDVFAAGPDASLWSPTSERDGFWHIAADGTATKAPGALPTYCHDPGASFDGMARASDGAMWLADQDCRRLIRVAPTGTTTVALGAEPEHLAADPAGGVWVANDCGDDGHVEHVDAAGHVRTFDLDDDTLATDDVAVAPDGTAWFATEHCRFLRISPTGEMSTAPSPVPTRELGFDPAGGLWIVSRARLAHLAPGEPVGTCDDRAPSVHIGPVRDGGHISLRGLRRLGGFTITVHEPAEIDALALYRDRLSRFGTPGEDVQRTIRAPRGGKVRYRVPAKQVRRYARALEAGHKPTLVVSAIANDAELNSDVDTIEIRVTR
jgi:hypothetical protein